MDAIEKTLLEQIAGLHEIPTGAYNIRKNGETESRNVTANIDIVSKSDGSGIEIHVKPGTRHESVHVPVILSQSGLNEVVYNDFYIGEGAQVDIVAGIESLLNIAIKQSDVPALSNENPYSQTNPQPLHFPKKFPKLVDSSGQPWHNHLVHSHDFYLGKSQQIR